MKVWPAPGRRVRDPASGQLLSARGATVPDTAFWRRRLADEDVLDAPPPKPTNPPKSKSATPRSSSAKRNSAINPESSD